jgi:hypothetical protein
MPDVALPGLVHGGRPSESLDDGCVCEPAAMVLLSLDALEAIIGGCWSEHTCDPVDLAEWSPANPARGQCGVTALVVQDLLGGGLVVAEVRNADGSRQGVHYWNRLDGGVELDLTREQFVDGEAIGPARTVDRPADLTGARLQAQYEMLASAVRAALDKRLAAPMSRTRQRRAKAAT